MKTKILDSNGEAVELTNAEQARANVLNSQYKRELQNSLGYEIDITSLTQLLKSVTEQKFYTIPVADYLPVVVGEGAWASEVVKYRDFSIGDSFGTGILNTGANHSRLAEVDSAVDAITTPVINWAKQISWSFMDLMQASRSGNWDLVTSKEKSRKRNWDLGIQELAFVGAADLPKVRGLLTLQNVAANTTLITKRISEMNATEFQALLAGLLEAYRANAQRTSMPTHFIIPESDFNGLASSVDETFPLKSRLERLMESLKVVTRNPNFQVLPNSYADQATNANIAGLNKNRYTLLNYDEDSIRMDIPVDYTNTLQNTINGFHFQNVGYGQFTGVQTYRPREVLYFDF